MTHTTPVGLKVNILKRTNVERQSKGFLNVNLQNKYDRNQRNRLKNCNTVILLFYRLDISPIADHVIKKK